LSCDDSDRGDDALIELILSHQEDPQHSGGMRAELTKLKPSV
jgi:hypothetical protein